MPSSNADWVFGVARLTSSASRMWPKIGPRWNWKCFRPSPSSTMMLVPMMSPGIRSGVNWIRENVRSSALGEGRDEQRLAEAGHTLQQHVAAGEEADQHVVDHVVVTDDHLLDLGAQGLEGGDELLHAPLLGLGRLDGLGHAQLLFPGCEGTGGAWVCIMIWVVPAGVNQPSPNAHARRTATLQRSPSRSPEPPGANPPS